MKIFDGHNDALLSVYQPERGQNRRFLTRSEHGHVDLPRARAGGLAGGLFAIFVPPIERDEPDEAKRIVHADGSVQTKFPPPLGLEHAQRETDAMIDLLDAIVADSGGVMVQARDAATLEAVFDGDDDRFAAVLHFEGAEAIDPSLEALPRYYERGLRSLGITWSRPNAFGHGVPFWFPGTPEIGGGLTDAGRALVRACNELGILLDVSHLNAAGFRDVAELSDAPLVATHANAHALCPAARNLLDDQIDAIGETGGIVGINFAVIFLRADGRNEADTPLERIADHLAWIADRIGIEHVGLGSDFDGARVPVALGDAAGLPRLLEALRGRGFTEADLEKIAHANWLRVLRQTWKPADAAHADPPGRSRREPPA